MYRVSKVGFTRGFGYSKGKVGDRYTENLNNVIKEVLTQLKTNRKLLKKNHDKKN